MGLKAVKGQDHAARCLLRAFTSGRVGHAYLFHGPASVGKRHTAREFALALACENPPEPGEACGGCEPCRLIPKGLYPDFRSIGPEEDKAGRGRSFHKETIAEAVSWAARTTYRHRRKIWILDSVHFLSDEAANSFLKMLEEPPAGTVWILISSDPSRVLPTIRSRCQPVRFGLLPREIAAQIARDRGAKEEQAAAAADLGMVPESLEGAAESRLRAAEIVRMAVQFNLPGLCSVGGDFRRKEEKEEKLPGLLDGLEQECGKGLRREADQPERWITALDAVALARSRYAGYMDKSAFDALGADLAMTLFRGRRA